MAGVGNAWGLGASFRIPPGGAGRWGASRALSAPDAPFPARRYRRMRMRSRPGPARRAGVPARSAPPRFGSHLRDAPWLFQGSPSAQDPHPKIPLPDPLPDPLLDGEFWGRAPPQPVPPTPGRDPPRSRGPRLFM